MITIPVYNVLLVPDVKLYLKKDVFVKLSGEEPERDKMVLLLSARADENRQEMDEDSFYELASPYLDKYLKEGLDKRKIAAMVRTRISVLPDIEEQVDFFNAVPDYDVSMYINKKSKSTLETSRQILGDVLPLLEAAESFDNDTLFAILSDYAKANERKINIVMWPLRTAVSGKMATPAGATGLMEVLGKEESLCRIRAAIAKLDEA